MGAHETAVHQLGLAAETIAELKRQLSATEECYQRVSDLAENLTGTLRSIRDANYREWDKGLDPGNTTTLATPAEFVKWAQNIARNAIDPSFTFPLPLNDDEIHDGCPYVEYEGGKIWFQAASWYRSQMRKRKK
jgi:hypothetical protein